MTLLTLIMYLVVVITASILPLRSHYSAYERTRRQKEGDKMIAVDIQREKVADDIAGVLRVISALALVVFILLALTTFGWLFGAIAAVAGVLCYGAIARLTPIHEACQRLYGRFERTVLTFVERHQPIFRFFRTVPDMTLQGNALIASREELVFTIEHLPALLSRDEQRMLTHGLGFGGKTVESVMTPRSVIDAVQQGDTIGPLLLDELHKTGHSRFPVIDGDVDHVVGVLYIHNLLQLHDKKTHKASSLMTTPVYYINQEQTLDHALAAFLRTHHHLFIVVNEYRETVGVLTLEDVIEALLGRKIVDEFDAHEDLRAVAARNPRGNNKPSGHTDV